MRFESETSVFKFLRGSVDPASSLVFLSMAENVLYVVLGRHTDQARVTIKN